MKRLILAPHCDDETLGCGGLLAKYQHECAVFVMARPDDVRYKEFTEAKRRLGYVMFELLNLPDGHVGQDMAFLVGQLDRLIAVYRPDEMYLPFPSMHQDHIATYEAGVRAGRLSMSIGHHFTPSIFVYDVAAYDLGLYPTDLKFNVFEALTEEHVDAKVEALQCYGSQAVTGPHPVNSIKQQSATVGHARQVDFAEPFALVRKVRV